MSPDGAGGRAGPGLRERIVQEIHRDGPIPFSRYMELCLYESELGYYSRPREQFGKAGDFYTSSDVHAVFGRLLARQFEEMWRALDSPSQIDLVELGPGRGLFARRRAGLVSQAVSGVFTGFALFAGRTVVAPSHEIAGKAGGAYCGREGAGFRFAGGGDIVSRRKPHRVWE